VERQGSMSGDLVHAFIRENKETLISRENEEALEP
jgi:hypothetical protein